MIVPILIAIGVMIVLGFVLGFLISIVTSKFKVEDDTRLTDLIELLPGVNCGACGCAGCSGFAQKILDKEANENGCKVIKGEPKDKLVAYIKENLNDQK